MNEEPDDRFKGNYTGKHNLIWGWPKEGSLGHKLLGFHTPV